MIAALFFFAALAAFGALIWLIGAQEPVYDLSAGNEPHWFIAIRGGSGQLGANVTQLFESRADFSFIGPDDAYWHRFIIASGGDASALPIDLGNAQDAYVARVTLRRPPRIVLGILKTLVTLGVLTKPKGPIARNPQDLGFRADLMPGAEPIARLLAQPPSYAPAMINFLAYKPQASYADGRETVSGRTAYARYGLVALRTVYRTGGRLLFAGRIAAVLREATAGPAIGHWDDVAAMQYPDPAAILSMEHAPDYNGALAHRDAGLKRTLVIASTRI
jgi:hypothetical protein